jgi:Peptidase family M20/M25/M40
MSTSASASAATKAEEQAQLDAFVRYVDDHEDLYKARLREAVAIPSVSAGLDAHLGDINAMIDWTVVHVERLGGTHELRPNPAGTADRPLPPILLADFPADSGSSSSTTAAAATSNNKKKKMMTVCVYGHLDVQPATREDGWDTDPFVLTEKDGKLYGRGSTDDKGPALSWYVCAMLISCALILLRLRFPCASRFLLCCLLLLCFFFVCARVWCACFLDLCVQIFLFVCLFASYISECTM